MDFTSVKAIGKQKGGSIQTSTSRFESPESLQVSCLMLPRCFLATKHLAANVLIGIEF